MRITGSQSVLASQRRLVETRAISESMRFWVGERRPDFEGREGLAAGSSEGGLSGLARERVFISDRAREALKEQESSLKEQVKTLQEQVKDLQEEVKDLTKQGKKIARETDGSKAVEIELSEKDKQKVLLLETLLSALTGKKVKIKLLDKIDAEDKSEAKDSTSVDCRTPERDSRQVQQPQREGWGLEYDYHEFYQEIEETSFSASGIIKTADGQEIQFNLQLDMTRSFTMESNVHIRAGDAKLIDPLIINYAGAAAELTDTKFGFDLDIDGKEEQVSILSHGSGFLALDLNNDGKVNNGGELFGPSTGNGFAELAGHDEDGNNWIDENDSVYDSLRLWTGGAGGEKTGEEGDLFTLREKGVGAIYLGNVDAQFSLKNNANEQLGQAQKAGIFVREDGSVGIVQQVDLAV